MMVKIVLILTYIITVKFTKPELTKFIVGGERAQITDFPYSALIHIKRDKKENVCGGSIINQEILLTAAHCVTRSKVRGFAITAFTGSNLRFTNMNKVRNFKIHEYFDELFLFSDIALLRLDKELTLGKRVKRIIIMKNPPKAKKAVVAGWGRHDLGLTWGSIILRHTNQQVLDKETCNAIVTYLPMGTLCARESSYPDKGDSGSALVIENKSIQIGIVSFKIPADSNDTIVYTNVSFYQHWIRDTAFLLYCKKELLKQKRERLIWEQKEREAKEHSKAKK